mmetsp:Transcript_85462/g.171112  ORF Transcript_85462/g.171112 Transcript_85462/m.171112 type:complete len:538 (-) Transcript_85462:796-2409(-)
MQAGTQVFITGLVGRTDLNEKEAIALRLERSGRYIVKVGNETVKLKLSSLIVKHHQENIGPPDMLTVNGLNFCSAHRLECCGACAYNFRIQNRLAALGSGEEEQVFSIAQEIDEEEEEQNLPPLRAPRSGEPAVEREPIKVPLNKKELVKRGLDPSLLPLWSASTDGEVQRSFQDAFSMQEMIMLKSNPEHQAPFIKLRKSLLNLSFHVEKKIGDHSYLLPRMAIQDKAQSECLMWDILTIHSESIEITDDTGKSSIKSSTPLFVIRWAYYTASSLRHLVATVQESLNLNPPGTSTTQWHCSVDEIRFFKQFLEQNARRLDCQFVERLVVGLPRGWGISTIRPITLEATEVKEVVVCAACGKEKASQVCSRCKETRYCSRECQTKHWKSDHKAVCKKPEDATKDLVTVDCSNNGLPPGFVAMNMSHSRSMSSNGNRTSGKSVAKAHKDDSMFVIKVQVNITPLPYGMDTGLMVYDKPRKFNIHISSKNCSEKYWSRLDTTIRRSGIAGCEFKGYFKAYLSNGMLKILDHQQLPLQPW